MQARRGLTRLHRVCGHSGVDVLDEGVGCWIVTAVVVVRAVGADDSVVDPLVHPLAERQHVDVGAVGRHRRDDRVEPIDAGRVAAVDEARWQPVDTH